MVQQIELMLAVHEMAAPMHDHHRDLDMLQNLEPAFSQHTVRIAHDELHADNIKGMIGRTEER